MSLNFTALMTLLAVCIEFNKSSMPFGELVDASKWRSIVSSRIFNLDVIHWQTWRKVSLYINLIGCIGSGWDLMTRENYWTIYFNFWDLLRNSNNWNENLHPLDNLKNFIDFYFYYEIISCIGIVLSRSSALWCVLENFAQRQAKSEKNADIEQHEKWRRKLSTKWEKRFHKFTTTNI